MAGQKRRKRFTNLGTKKLKLHDDHPSSEEAVVTTHQTAPLKRSKLEDLPTELLQEIFLYSANYELPLVSRTLLSQLSDTTMVSTITKALLRPFRPGMIGVPTPDEIKMVRGLFERRFFSMNLLRECCYRILQEKDDAKKSKPRGSSVQKTLALPSFPAVQDIKLRSWLSENDKHSELYAFDPRLRFLYRIIFRADLPAHFPSRYLRGPWNEDKLIFLGVYSYICGAPSSPITRDGLTAFASKPRFRTALNDAVESNSLEATKLLCAIHVPVEQEHLRAAVKYSSESQNVFSFLLFTSVYALNWSDRQANSRRGVLQIRQLDYLDPILWQWATEMETAGDRRGRIVTEQLKAAAEDQAVCMSYLPRKHNSWPQMPSYENWLEGDHFV